MLSSRGRRTRRSCYQALPPRCPAQSSDAGAAPCARHTNDGTPQVTSRKLRLIAQTANTANWARGQHVWFMVQTASPTNWKAQNKVSPSGKGACTQRQQFSKHGMNLSRSYRRGYFQHLQCPHSAKQHATRNTQHTTHKHTTHDSQHTARTHTHTQHNACNQETQKAHDIEPTQSVPKQRTTQHKTAHRQSTHTHTHHRVHDRDNHTERAHSRKAQNNGNRSDKGACTQSKKLSNVSKSLPALTVTHTHNTQHTTHITQHTTNAQHTTRKHTTHNTQHRTHSTQHTIFKHFLESGALARQRCIND